MKMLSKMGEKEQKDWKDIWVNRNYALIFGGLFLAALMGTYFFWLNGRVIPGISISGLEAGGLQINEVSRMLTQELLPGQQKKVTLSYQNRTFDVVLGTIGIQPDLRGTVQRAYAMGRTGSVLNRLVTIFRVWRWGREVPLQFKHNHHVLESFYRLLDASIGREPVRAVVRVGTDGRVRYTQSVEGRLIDRQKLTELFETAVAHNELQQIEIPIRKVSPTLTSADIRKWRLDQVVGMYVTRFNPNAAERSHNLKTACSALDNVIIYPGQNFSFNTWIGPRMANTGYKEAPVVWRGKLVPGIGGGVCQVSSTLYNAVLLANLQVVKRYNHSLASTYVPLGRDATVVTGGQDFIFTNTLASPVLLTAEVNPPYVRVAVLGEKGNWDRVELETRTVATYPFETKEIQDPELEWGETLKQEPGKEGYKVELWRSVYFQDGSVKKSRVNTSIYPAQPEEYKVGTKIPS
ncbi:MAG TPA: VanW family protein [Bacillota bacterium]|nr:VanW family protein [Bacillota bacterium]